eukprot:g7923.t1
MLLHNSGSPTKPACKMAADPTANPAVVPAASAPPTDAAATGGLATVWNVISGDTFEVCVGVTRGQVELKRITMAGVIAPRLGLKTQQVKSLGFYSELEQCENEAKSIGTGVHASTGMVREVSNAADSPEDFLSKNKEKLRPCVVEFIKDAGCYRVVCLPTVEDPQYVTAQILLSGVQNPTFRREAGGVEVEAQPGNGAFFARAFALERLLGREVSLRVEAIQRQGAPGSQTVFFLGSLVHPVKGSIAEFFLEEGYGLYVDWSAAKAYSGCDALQKAQKRAQDAKKRRWKNWDGTETNERFEFTGKVTEVCSGDVLRIVDTDSPQRVERRYYLASVRGPQVVRGKQDEGWAPHVIEFMRKKLIGKQFKVRLEYKKNISVFGEGAHPPASNEANGDMYFVSLLDANKKNCIIEAVEAGMLKVLANTGGADSMNERSRDFDLLMEAEAVAMAGGKGIHLGEEKAPKMPVMTELILQPPNAPKGRGPSTKKELTERAKAFESQLSANRNGHLAVVSYIMNGSRMRLKLVHEKIHLTFQMNGIRAPNAERLGMPAHAAANVPKPEPFGTESLQLARELCMQQDVKVTIDRVDPAGAFQGTLYLQKGTQKTDMGMMLLEKGLAYCDQWCNNNAYFNAEAKAKAAKLNYWSVEHDDQAAVVTEQVASGTPIRGEISTINSLDSFYVVPSGGAELKIQNELAQGVSKFEEFLGGGSGMQPSKRGLYAVQYWEDKKWYRGRYEGKGSEGLYSFFFVDFGYKADVDHVRKLPVGNSLATAPATAKHCALYGVKTNLRFWEDACESFFKKTDKKAVNGTRISTIEGSSGAGQNSVVLFLSNGICLNESLLKDAVARLTRKENKPSAPADYAAWQKSQADAKRSRNKMWRYGDVGSDDEDY